MYVYIYVCVYIYLCIYIDLSICMFIVYIYIYIYIYMYVYCVCIYMCVYTCVCVYMCIYGCMCIYVCVYMYRAIGQMSRVFANDPGEQGSIPGRVIPKTEKMFLDVTLLSTQRYKVRINGKVEQSRKWSCALSSTLV